MKRMVVLLSVLSTSLASLAAPAIQAKYQANHKSGQHCFESASLPTTQGEIIEELCFESHKRTIQNYFAGFKPIHIRSTASVLVFETHSVEPKHVPIRYSICVLRI